MAEPNEFEGLVSGWRALSGGQGEGWRTIEIGADVGIPVRAGRHFPGDQEAVLFGFASHLVPPAPRLPLGRGFSVTRVDLPANPGDGCWVALARAGSASPELFAAMAKDVLQALMRVRASGGEALIRTLIARVTAWQEFMERGDPPVLGPEAELGLVGEVAMLLQLMRSGVSGRSALEAWKGPIHGLRDFLFGAGAIEVKASVAKGQFPAKVDSLEQLDDSNVSPIFVAALRFEVGEGGRTLPMHVDEVNSLLGDPVLQGFFEDRLVRGGYLEQYADRYGRRFTYANGRFIQVTSAFPRLVRTNVPTAVMSARYTVDLDQVENSSASLGHVLSLLGAI